MNTSENRTSLVSTEAAHAQYVAGVYRLELRDLAADSDQQRHELLSSRQPLHKELPHHRWRFTIVYKKLFKPGCKGHSEAEPLRVVLQAEPELLHDGTSLLDANLVCEVVQDTGASLRVPHYLDIKAADFWMTKQQKIMIHLELCRQNLPMSSSHDDRPFRLQICAGSVWIAEFEPFYVECKQVVDYNAPTPQQIERLAKRYKNHVAHDAKQEQREAAMRSHLGITLREASAATRRTSQISDVHTQASLQLPIETCFEEPEPARADVRLPGISAVPMAEPTQQDDTNKRSRTDTMSRGFATPRQVPINAMSPAPRVAVQCISAPMVLESALTQAMPLQGRMPAAAPTLRRDTSSDSRLSLLESLSGADSFADLSVSDVSTDGSSFAAPDDGFNDARDAAVVSSATPAAMELPGPLCRSTSGDTFTLWLDSVNFSEDGPSSAAVDDGIHETTAASPRLSPALPPADAGSGCRQ